MCIYEFSELFLLNTWFLNLKRAYLFSIENGETADLQCSLPSPAARGARTQTATCRNWLFLTAASRSAARCNCSASPPRQTRRQRRRFSENFARQSGPPLVTCRRPCHMHACLPATRPLGVVSRATRYSDRAGGCSWHFLPLSF